ncbi:MAG: HAMP domain-containing histidine kinase [Oscillospiraceae bacterium]|nr:HAMP domain-containing histidine kinase [Oscillospiraceae bacterium]
MLLLVKKMLNIFFGKGLELRIRLFNILACIGFASGLFSGIYGFIISANLNNLLLNLALVIFSASILWYATNSKNYQRCYVITIIIVFFIIFPMVFINLGSYTGGIPMFFVFAVLVTVFMLTGKKMFVFVGMELVLYTSLFLYAYFYPENVSHISNEITIVVDNIVVFLIVSAGLSAAMAAHIHLFDKQNKELEAARKQSEEYAKMKGELFAEMSHEMRTPLTVMSAYAQFAVEQIRVSGANEQTLADLSTISEEAKRLAEMADGTLKILLSSSETAQTNAWEAMPVDAGDLANRLMRLLTPVARRKGKNLTLFIEDGIPEIQGDADELTQLLWNITQNAVTHARSNIEMAVRADGAAITVTLKDDGYGIKPDILPRIFERGVSGGEEKSGIGLSICRDIAIKHGGDISIQNEPGAGVCVSVTLKGKAEL